MKSLSDSYLYQTTDYEKRIFEFIMSADRVDKSSDGFADVIYDVKRQTNAVLMKVLLSDKVVLCMDAKGLSRPFKVMYCKDVKEKKDKKKVFIDCTGIITLENGVYKCTKAATLISYVMTAMTYIIYYNLPKAILTDHVLMKAGTEAFVDMMLYVLGYLKVPVTYADNKERMAFVLAEYFQLCIAGHEPGEQVFNLAKATSKLADKKTCDYLHTLFYATFDEGNCKFDQFLKKFAEVFLGQVEGENAPKNRVSLTVDSFAQRWMYAFGPGTIFGLECFVPFSQILTDCYMGAFLNQQNTIEKVCGKNVITFSHELLKIGTENA